MITFYTDASIKNLHAGLGVVALVDGIKCYEGKKRIYVGSNRSVIGEIMAIVGALRLVTKERKVRVFTDSKSAVDLVAEEKKRERTWLKGNGKPYIYTKAMRLLDRELDGRSSIKINFIPRASHEHNIRADRLARSALFEIDLADDLYPGELLSEGQARRLHAIRRSKGYTKPGFTLLLGEFGLISTNDITQSIYDEVVNMADSAVLAEKYNQMAQRRMVA